MDSEKWIYTNQRAEYIMCEQITIHRYKIPPSMKHLSNLTN